MEKVLICYVLLVGPLPALSSRGYGDCFLQDSVRLSHILCFTLQASLELLWGMAVGF